MDLKLSILKKKLPPADKKIISLKGALKGVDITDKDITSAKHLNLPIITKDATLLNLKNIKTIW